MIRIALSIALSLWSTACVDQIAELGPSFVENGSVRTRAEVTCPASARGENETACFFDSSGKTYPQDSRVSGTDGRSDETFFILEGANPILAIDPPYGFSFRFNFPVALTEADLSTGDPDASIQVYAAPFNARVCTDLPDSDEKYRIAWRVEPSEEGGLLAFIDDALPAGTQIVFNGSYGALLARHFPLPESAPWKTLEEAEHFRFSVRAYVGGESMNESCP